MFPMYRFRRTPFIAILFFLLGSFSAASWAEDAAAVPPNARWSAAEPIEAGTPADPERSPTGSYGWKIPSADSPDWKGLGRDTSYFLAYQFLIVGVLWLAPESTSGWSKEDKEELKWGENVSDPHRDEDDPYVNYILHPYWGASYYTRGRERGLDRTQSFLFSTALSTLYEFGVEAFFEKPSYQDLWTTPVLGSLLGEFVFTPIRARIRAKPGAPDWKDKTILFLTDPLGVVGAKTDELLGVQTTLRLQAFQPELTARSSPRFGSVISTADGALRQAAPAWGLQLHVRW